MTSRSVLRSLSLAAILGGSLLACAPAGSGSDVPDASGVDRGEENLGASQRSYVTLRRDYRKCSAPMCGGWFVKDVNRKNPKEQYVASLDFTVSDLDEVAIGQVEGAPAGEVVLHGKLADLAAWDDPAIVVFQVTSAWRGMPGAVVAAGETYFQVAAMNPQISCFTAPCPSLDVTPLHKTKTEQIERVATDGFVEPRLDQAWLQKRLATGGALAAGVVADGAVFPGGAERVLDASQVFIRLPEGPDQACPLAKPACDLAGGEIDIYARDADHCIVYQGCTQSGACTQQVPSCADGYGLVSWRGGMFGCTVHTCDPAFLIPEVQAEEPPVEEPVEG